VGADLGTLFGSSAFHSTSQTAVVGAQWGPTVADSQELEKFGTQFSSAEGAVRDVPSSATPCFQAVEEGALTQFHVTFFAPSKFSL